MLSVRATAVTGILGLALATIHAAGESPQHAESLLRKVALIQERADTSSPAPAPVRTTVSEIEVNSWFAYHASPHLPTGLARPRVSLPGSQHVIATAIVDLDVVARARASGRTFDVWNLIGGTVPVTVRGVLHTQNGHGRFDVQAADVSGVTVPLRVLEELVHYYSRTPDNPEGVRLTDPFELPAGIRQIELRRGAAVVLQ